MRKSYMLFALIAIILPSCAKRDRAQYLVPETKEPTFVASPLLKQIISEKDGTVLVDKLESVEKAAKEELRQVKKTAQYLRNEIKMKHRILKSNRDQKITQLREQYNYALKQARIDLQRRIKSVENETQMKIETLAAERRKKEIKFVDSAKQKVLEKVNLAEMDLLKHYIATKRKASVSPAEAQIIEDWKKDSSRELEKNMVYLIQQLGDDEELQEILNEKQKSIETNITHTVKIGDPVYNEATQDLKSLTTMRKAYQTADQILDKKLTGIDTTDEDEQHIKLIIQSELPSMIQKAVNAEQEVPQRLINKIIINAIDEVKRPKIVTQQELQEKITVLKEELTQEKKDKLDLQIAKATTYEQLTQEKSLNVEQLKDLQKNLGALKETLQGHIQKQIDLKKLLEKEREKLKISQLNEQEKGKKIDQLQEHLNRSTVSKFYAEIEAAKIKNLQTQLDELRSALYTSKEDVEVAKNKIVQLQEEKERQKLSFKIKRDKLIKEKELLRKAKISQQEAWSKNARLRGKIEKLNKKLKTETKNNNRSKLIEKINNKTALLEQRQKDIAKKEIEFENKKTNIAEEISDLKATLSTIRKLTSQIKKQLALN